MDPSRRSASVTAAAALAVLGSLLSALGILFFFAPTFVPPPGNTAELPAAFRWMAQAISAIGFACSLVGLLTGVGLFRLKNWARISALIWSGITVFLGSMAIFSIASLSFPETPGVPPAVAHSMKPMLLLAYGIPVLIGAWWLVLFNQKSVKAQFGSADVAGDGVAGNLAARSGSTAKNPPRCPLPLAIFAGFILLTVAGMFLMPLLHIPVYTIVFGHRLRGEWGAFVFAAMAATYLAAAIGLLTLKRWSHPLLMGLAGFWMVSGFVTRLSPSYLGYLQDVFHDLQLPDSSLGALEIYQNKSFALLALLPGALSLGVLLYDRARFRTACLAAENAKS